VATGHRGVKAKPVDAKKLDGTKSTTDASAAKPPDNPDLRPTAGSAAKPCDSWKSLNGC
jgi:hypothetical protein